MWDKCSSEPTSQPETQSFQQSSTEPSQQSIATIPTDNGDVNVVSDVDALGNCTISTVNNGSSPVTILSVVTFATTLTGVLSATTNQALRQVNLAVSNSVVVSPQVNINGFSQCDVTIELPTPFRFRVIVSRATATVFNIIYRVL